MKTKVKEDVDRSIDEDCPTEPATTTRARKKAATEELSKDEPKTFKETHLRKNLVNKPAKLIVKKRPLGISKTLRNKKVVVVKDAVRNTVKRVGGKKGRPRIIKLETSVEVTPDKETITLIPPSEIKKEPVDDISPGSRSSSPRTAAKRQRISSDMLMMKSVLVDTPSTLVLGSRTSPYSMRSERSNSPSMVEGNPARRGRKPKTKLLNKVVKNEQKKRGMSEGTEEGKKRARSCSHDSSEVSKCSDITESDGSLCESINDADSKDNQESVRKMDESKTDIDVDIDSSIPISTINTKVPCFIDDSKLDRDKSVTDHSNILIDETKKKMSLKGTTSVDSDNNNGRNRFKLDNIHNSSQVEDKLKIKRKTDKEALLKTRSSILTSMSKTFNTKEVTQNIRKARRGRKAANAGHTTLLSPVTQAPIKNGPTVISEIEPIDSGETLETLTTEIEGLISTLEDDRTQDEINDSTNVDETPMEVSTVSISSNEPVILTKSVSKFYGHAEVKPLTDNNIITIMPETPIKDKEAWSVNNNVTPSKIDDSENIRLHLDVDEDSMGQAIVSEKATEPFKCVPVASIDKLMDRLKVFEEFDKKRQSEQMKTETKSVMVTSDVVLIPKSGADIKPLKDIQSVRSPEQKLEKENVLSCFENNSAISIVKRDQIRKSVDIDLPNSVTLIKRNSVHSRKESTGSNHSRESSDAVAIFEKSFGKDVTLTEIRKSVEKSAPSTPIEVHQFASLHANTITSGNTNFIKLDSNQISITPRILTEHPKPGISSANQILEIKARNSISRKSLDSVTDQDDKVMSIDKMKSPPHINNHQLKSPPPFITSLPPVAIKSPEAQPMDTEALPPPIESVKPIPDNISMTSETPKIQEMVTPETSITELPQINVNKPQIIETKTVSDEGKSMPNLEETPQPVEIKVQTETTTNKKQLILSLPKEVKILPRTTETGKDIKEPKTELSPVALKVSRGPGRPPKSATLALDSQPGPSNIFNESPENQKRKENVLRTLGLLTHKAAKEAKIEKQREKERIYAKSLNQGSLNKNKVSKSGTDYTGTLKTVIKVHRSSGEKEKGRKYRSSLKMTFQKSKHRAGKPIQEVGEMPAEVEPFYTIERREGIPGTSPAEGQPRKPYSNRFNNDGVPVSAIEPVVEPTKEPALLVIPEKASSFSIHPGRLCLDQCCYCGGKFGLFDTPCHIAQMKSADRQKKVLDNEEKLTIDSCLCDACYRHVDRRANCPSYRKRPLIKVLSAPQAQSGTNPDTGAMQMTQGLGGEADKSLSPPLDDDSEDESSSLLNGPGGRGALCHAAGCGAAAEHTIRRKWLIKMRNRVNSVIKLELDYPGLHTIPLCGPHHRALLPLTTCQLCRRRINKHHNLHLIKHGYQELNPLLAKEGIPIQFQERPVLCKVCRYYCTLLQRPGYNDKHARSYRIRLLQTYNIEVPPEIEHDADGNKLSDHDISINTKQKKKNKMKSKQKKSSEPNTGDEMVTEPIVEILEDCERMHEYGDGKGKSLSMDEDIESLISSNKILVPSKPSSGGASIQSDISDQDMHDLDGTLLQIDKQTELQYLLQKQNNPSQFIHNSIPNLTQKHKNLLKMHNSGIQKSGFHQKIMDKNSKKIHKVGQMFLQKDKLHISDEIDVMDIDRLREGGLSIMKNITLNDECTIESIPTRKAADINTLKNKWQMSESFTQVQKNLSELTKLSGDKGKKSSVDIKYSNPVKRLETNPSISVRELFPGEEEMNLQCNVEFNNVKGVTPEGWEKCNTTIQYDVETRKLWTELQRPYGNQSSFLRHLVLLEKYFRNGDLVLAQSATNNAVTYSDSVQSRLKSYDNVPFEKPKRNDSGGSLIEFRKKPFMNGKSLLKSNLGNNEPEKPKSPEMKKPLPPGVFAKPKPIKPSSSDVKVNKSKPLPPELIAINAPSSQGKKGIQNVLHNIQQLVKGVSASDPTEIAAAPLPPPKFETPKTEIVKVEIQKPPQKKQKTTSKLWRPTLMPITPENLEKIASEPVQVAVDGRSLPSLVQVMSSGKRYHITLQDYNKMCIMRREKLKQIQDGEKAKRPPPEGSETTLVTEIQPSALLGNGGTVKQTIDKTDHMINELSELSQMGSNAATILKNVGLKNITIAPIPAKTATVTSQTLPVPMVTSPSLLVTSTSMKLPHLGPAVTITSEPLNLPTNTLPIVSSQPSIMVMPKIPKSLTVIPQTLSSVMPQIRTPLHPLTATTSMIPTTATPVPIPPNDDPRP